MDKDQIFRIIESGESQEVEFKESFHSFQEFSKIMCGFANTYGGIVIVGVNAKKEAVGLKEDADKLQQKISSSAQAISPPIIPSIEVHDINNRKIITIVIQRAIDNTFHTFQGVIWVKIGSTLKKIEGNQIVDFLRSKQILCFDETPNNAKISDIDANKIKDYLSIRKQLDYFKSHAIEDFLISMKLATKNGDLRIKNSALLFFAKNPIAFNPQIELKLVRFEGAEPVKIIAHELVQTDLIESIEKALSFVKTNISKSIQIKLDAKREEKYQYPVDVIREAIVNAVVHRNYFSKDAIQIYIFSDRIEITNPGSLPQGLPKELFGTLSVQRNPLTYKILRDYGYVEGLGSGVPRMINSMRERGLPDPEFGIYEQFFRIVLRNQSSNLKPIKEHSNLNERQLKAIKFLKENKSMKTKMHMRINRVSSGTARLDINEMIKFGYIKKIGSFRGVYYILNEEK
ncbi:MAG: putative DNA binding domain-containing protein [Nanoarchaeota archaeon]|nr:putative DNA binding domain-containing protein [Nanoarchaeota archaeon]